MDLEELLAPHVQEIYQSGFLDALSRPVSVRPDDRLVPLSVIRALLLHIAECLENDRDPQPGSDAILECCRAPEPLVFIWGISPQDLYRSYWGWREKSFWGFAPWNPAAHPRGPDGKFIPTIRIEQAAAEAQLGRPQAIDQLRRETHPESREALERIIELLDDPDVPKESRHERSRDLARRIARWIKRQVRNQSPVTYVQLVRLVPVLRRLEPVHLRALVRLMSRQLGGQTPVYHELAARLAAWASARQLPVAGAPPEDEGVDRPVAVAPLRSVGPRDESSRAAPGPVVGDQSEKAMRLVVLREVQRVANQYGLSTSEYDTVVDRVMRSLAMNPNRPINEAVRDVLTRYLRETSLVPGLRSENAPVQRAFRQFQSLRQAAGLVAPEVLRDRAEKVFGAYSPEVLVGLLHRLGHDARPQEALNRLVGLIVGGGT